MITWVLLIMEVVGSTEEDSGEAFNGGFLPLLKKKKKKKNGDVKSRFVGWVALQQGNIFRAKKGQMGNGCLGC
ncbi:hypothetical protein L6452_11016 [Arctium lappa]|uniref:Uncharacterized protein n=1 Tax=Arctium lappa TaxID=4217 RepID=A0ACB9DNB1_ARCLA|nr:hypothetical protein L6452_11016 [Arctium lappa]